MENIYLFIIWHKALWCKKKIINDLKDSFEILNDVTIEWSSDQFNTNLLSLYGRKLGSPREKIKPCGKGSFCLLIVRDNKSKFELRKMFDSEEVVNSHIYDKKMLYRKWTGGCHRIHCSDTKEETLHDLVVLFGPNYMEILNNKNKLSINTKTTIGFNSIDDLTKSLKLFGNNITTIKNDNIFIFSKCRYDIASFTGCKQINANKYSIDINNKQHTIYIFGELDGDLPKESYKDNNFDNLIIENLDSYISYINNKNTLPSSIKDYASKKSYDLNLKHTNVARISKKEPFYKALLKDIKLLICRIRYSI